MSDEAIERALAAVDGAAKRLSRKEAAAAVRARTLQAWTTLRAARAEAEVGAALGMLDAARKTLTEELKGARALARAFEACEALLREQARKLRADREKEEAYWTQELDERWEQQGYGWDFGGAEQEGEPG